MGGIGKTQVALEYVYRNKKNYARTYWISAVDQMSLLSGYNEIAKMAGLKLAPESTPVETAEHVLHWLRQEPNWLLVIDNLDVIEVVKGFLPENGTHKHTVITTRNPNADGIPAEGVEIRLLDSDEAVELLSTLSKVAVPENSTERQDAALIVQTLDHLPLAIEQAAAFIREVTQNYSSFLKHYQKRSRELHNWVPKGNRQYKFSVATTWSLSFDIIRKTYPTVAKLFQILSFFNPDGILIDFLISSSKALDTHIREIIEDEITRSDALLELEKFSLIKWNRLESETIVIHRLVQAVIRDEMSPEDVATLARDVVDMCDASFPEEWNMETKPICRMYFAQVLTPLQRTDFLETEKLGIVIERVASCLFQDGKYNDSAELWKMLVKIRTNANGAEHQKTLYSMHNLAETYRQQGKFTEAATMHEDVLAKTKAILGEDHPDTLASMHSLAETYRQQGKFTEAATIHEDVLAKKKAISGEDHPSTLTSMHSLAETYRQQGKLTEAATMHEDVLAKRKAISGEDHPDTLTSMLCLATTYCFQGKLVQARSLFEKVYAKRKLVLGESHPHTQLAKDWLDHISQRG